MSEGASVQEQRLEEAIAIAAERLIVPFGQARGFGFEAYSGWCVSAHALDQIGRIQGDPCAVTVRLFA